MVPNSNLLFILLLLVYPGSFKVSFLCHTFVSNVMTLLVASGGGVRVRTEWEKVRELSGVKARYTHRIGGYTGVCIFKKNKQMYT